MKIHTINFSSCVTYLELPQAMLEQLQEGDTLAINWDAFKKHNPAFVEPGPYNLSRTDMAIVMDALDNGLKVLLEINFELKRFLLTSVKPMGAENLQG
ncbi:hypothetical protein [Chryseolinea lacunae]|uniref:Uncharacterized protein n=1 Tax=Chryseolinea lacunae TaxID=2801331 RepID=A0ABS1L005_9BACT|nr:hypothetical protein [Chryseolinea lacunae]MBL0744763.1 hypothetical protein [Chryseolinea lacunae]